MDQQVFYSLRDIPEGLDVIDELDLELKWETAIDPERSGAQSFTGIEELNELLKERIRTLLLDKGGECVRVKYEKISHSKNYAHMSLIVVGEYHFEVLGKKK
jgi:hypothetical protein